MALRVYRRCAGAGEQRPQEFTSGPEGQSLGVKARLDEAEPKFAKLIAACDARLSRKPLRRSKLDMVKVACASWAPKRGYWT